MVSHMPSRRKGKAAEKATAKVEAVENIEEKKAAARGTEPIRTTDLPIMSSASDSPLPDDVLEVWFAGTHSGAFLPRRPSFLCD